MPRFEENQSLGNFFPAPGRRTVNLAIGTAQLPYIDSVGNLSTRGPITTDEGSVREDFPGTTIYTSITGTLSFKNGSKTVIGTGTTFTDGTIAYGDYIKLSTDSDTTYAKILSVINDTTLQLVTAYTGTTGTGTGYKVKFKPITGTGGAVTVASSSVTISSGATTNSRTTISREIDYGPLVYRETAFVSQRISNQDGYIGFADDPVSPIRRAWFKINGTSNTQIITETSSSSSANDTESNTITLPNGLTTASVLRYRIVLNPESCRFYINEYLVAEHFLHLPDQYSTMDGFTGWVNGPSAPASNSNIVCDMIYVGNFDQLQTSTVTEQTTTTNCASNNNNGTNYHLISVASTNATVLKAAPGRINNLLLTNGSAAIKFFKLYDKATAPTVGTDIPIATIGVPATSTIQGVVNDIGIYFSSGISFATTGAITDADTTALALGDMAINITYA